MIIWGRSGRTSTLDTGTFECPVCRQSRSYARRQVRRWFTLYFVPCFPLDVIADYIECATCGETFGHGVFDDEATSEDAVLASDYRRAFVHVIVSMMLADGVVAPEEIESGIDLYDEAFGFRVSDERVRRKIDELRDAHDEGLEHLRGLARHLSTNGRAAIVRAGYRVAAADSRITDDEQRYLQELARALGLTRERFQDLVVACRDEAHANRSH